MMAKESMTHSKIEPHLWGTPDGAEINFASSSTTFHDLTPKLKDTAEVPSNAELPRKEKLLPPCRVCGEKASGLHYGVNTCEACKGFFRRSISKGANFQCSEIGRCDVASRRRNSCAACRYRKCLALGMSKEAIKIGRYTHEKKTQYIREVRGIDRSLSSPSEGPTQSRSPRLDAEDMQRDYPMATNSSPSISSGQLCNTIQPDSTFQSDSSEDLATVPYTTFSRSFSMDTQSSNLATEQETNSIGFSENVNEIFSYMHLLGKALVHMKYFFNAKPPTELSHIVMRHQEVSKLETALFGDEIMSTSDYVRVLTKTGLDLDQRRTLIQHWAENIEETFVVIAQFAKCTPGFSSISLSDQVKMVQATGPQLLFIASHRRFDVKNKCFLSRFNHVDSYQDMVKIYNEKEFVDEMLKLAAALLKIKLSDLEWLLVMAIILTYPEPSVYDSVSPAAREHLLNMHRMQTTVFEFYMKMNHSDKPHLGSRILAILAEMRQLNKVHNSLAQDLKSVWAAFYSFPPICEEIIAKDSTQCLLPKELPEAHPEILQPSRPLHWKKSKIAAILESSEHIERLMNEAATRSPDEAPSSRTYDLDISMPSNSELPDSSNALFTHFGEF